LIFIFQLSRILPRKITTTELRLAPAPDAPDFKPDTDARRKPKIGGYDFSDPASE
jgi:hypothetical protein